MGDACRHELPPETTQVAVARRLAADALGGRIDTPFLTALSEVVTNAITAHRSSRNPAPIIMTIDATAGWVEVANSTSWTPSIPDRPPAPSSVTGRGLIVASTLCPGLAVDKSDDILTVRLPVDGGG